MSTETTVYFVRHAHSPWVPDAEAERGLSEEGKADAERVADILPDDIDAAISSPYARAVETLEPFTNRTDTDLHIEEGFRERLLSPDPVESFGETFDSAVERVWSDWEFAWAGGESNLDAQARGVDALERALARHEGETIAVGTHGNLLTLTLNYYDPAFDYDFWRDELGMPDVYRATFAGGELTATERVYG
ncbi:histidine phosphatase family protein [Natronomonas sp. EA1]|uniref:histidine phosphatase family protein n=1 Tax=Natronomonas sp. EA1 TaxID=3421655 RepID=UPI003EC055B7